MADKRIKGITIEIGGDTSKLDKALSGVNKTLRDSQAELKDINKLLKLDPGNTDLLKQKYEALTKSVDATKEKLQTLKTAQEQAAQALAKGDISQAQYDALQREIIETTNELKNLEEQARESSVAVVKLAEAGDKIQSLGGKIEGVGQKFMPVTAAIGAVGAGTAKMASDFEDAIAKVSTIADTTEKPMEELRKEILALSNDTGIAAGDIADSVYNAISAGQKTGDAVTFVSNATKLAKAGFTDTGSALDVLTTIMNAYGLEAEEVTKVSDTLIQTQNLGKTTVGELAAVMGKIIPTAKQNGVALDSLAAGYAVMTSNGIATAETTTYMNSMLNELGKQGSAAYKAFAEGTKNIKEGGLTMAEAMEQGWELTDVLSVLDEQAQLSGTSIKNMFGSAEAGTAAAVLWDNATQVNDVVAQMRDSANATDEAFEKLDTTSLTVEKAINQAKNAGIELGTSLLTMLAPALEKIADGVSKFSEWFSKLDESQKTTIITIAGIVAAIGPLLVTIGKLTTGVGSIISLGAKLIPIIAGISAPVLIVIAAVAALVAIGVTLYKNWDTIKEKAGELKENLSNKWQDMKTNAAQKWDDMKNDIHTKWEDMKQTAKDKWSEIKDNVKNSKTGEAAGEVLEAAKTTVKEKLSNIKKAYEDHGGGVKGVVSAYTEAIKGFWSAGLTFIDKLTDGKLTDLKNRFTEKFDAIKQKISDTVDSIKEKFDNLKLKLPDIKLPHFKIDGELSLNPPKVPKLSIDWYAKAMQQGMILNSPTIFGAAGGRLLGAGEAGAEAVVGVGSLQSMIQNAVGSTGINTMVSLMQQYLPYLAEGTEIRLDTGALVGNTVRQMNSALGQISAREARR